MGTGRAAEELTRSQRPRRASAGREGGRGLAGLLAAAVFGCAGPLLQTELEATADCQPALFDAAPGAFDRYRFVGNSGLSGYRDFTGTVVIDARFAIAYEFSQEGIAAAIDPKLGPVFIGLTGRVLAQALVFDKGPDYFQEGRARIIENGKVGFIDRSGAVVIAPRFDFAWPFCRGIARVCLGCEKGQGGESFEIDRDGKIAPQPLGARQADSDGLRVERESEARGDLHRRRVR